jgi:hypothetical protein
VALLPERSKDETQITEEVMVAAARNWGCGMDVMTLLLHRGGDIQTTEEVMKAAAGNEWYGEDIITLLLKWSQVGFQITEEVLKSARENKWCGKAVIALLSESKDERI